MECPSPEGGAISGVIAFIGIGANMGRPAAACREAVVKMAEIWGQAYPLLLFLPDGACRATGTSMVHQCCSGDPDGTVTRKLFSALKEIERRMGRTVRAKWGPRVIDLDLLLYGQEVIQEGGLVIPHPELHRRRFVLVPLCELASYAIHPAFGVSVRGLLDRLTDPARVELYDPARDGQEWIWVLPNANTEKVER